MERFRVQMDADNPDWEIAAIFSKINLYYFTGTMQDGMLLIPRDDEAVLWVRRNYDRALDESFFPRIRQMGSFRDAAKDSRKIRNNVHLEAEVVPLALLRRFLKHFPCSDVRPLDAVVAGLRAVKSAYELSFMEEAGEIHRRVLEERAPGILSEGMSEAVFAGRLYALMVEEGHHGVVRFGMFDTEIAVGQIGFGESSIYPTSFDGPGGNYGMSPAVPTLGSRTRRLKSGDLVFVDVGCGVAGYHTDKTMTYMFGKPIPDEAIEHHRRCVEIQHEIASLLKPGAHPSDIYDAITADLPLEFSKNFMGYDNRRVKFLGHGIGLQVDEPPVIAGGFHEPLQAGMVIALEPKIGVKDVGMVGIENTFVVAPGGGRCITGEHPGLMPLY